MEFTRIWYKLIGLVCTTCFIIGCAEIVPPPGGEVDKTRPQITETSPENGAVSVPIDNKVTIHFSEKITKPQTSAVFISPRLQEEPKLKWSSDKVLIEFPDSFKTDQTYIISLSEVIRDYRNNPIDTGSIIAFSTGPEIARGKISGTVVGINEKPVSSVLVGLYRGEVFTDEQPIDSIYPDYIVQTDKNGIYSFRYLPFGKYILFGFQDKNKNERFNPASEYYALPEGEVVLGSLLHDKTIDLVLTQADTNSVKIRSAFLDTDKMVRVNLSKPIDLESVRENIDSVTITSLTDNQSYNALFCTESGDESIETFNFYFGDIAKENYSLRFVYETNQPVLTFDTMRITEADDNTAPSIKSFSPDNQPVLFSDLEFSIYFSEPIDTNKLTDETFAILNQDSSVILPQRKIVNQSFIKFSSSVLANPGQYQFLVSAFDITDLSDNNMGDTVLNYPIKILDPDSMGTIAGKVTINDSLSGNLYLLFKNIRNQKVTQLLYSSESFNLSLMAGDYQIAGFVDRNNNRKRDTGRLFPLEYAEQYYILPDTITVRARFETSDIEFILE
ncbi:MAG: hypothetical protein DWP97_08155 [Calditrichaeota bacterium]|nr:MAG: hypothetical protein DWP97_08155 [Calditrichota bacterium]